MASFKSNTRTGNMWSQLDNMVFYDVAKIIGEKKARLYMGRGVEFKHKDPKKHDQWHKFYCANSFFNFMFANTKLHSESGSAIVTINKSKDGMALLNVAHPYFAQGIETSFQTPDLAVLIEQFTIDNQLHLVRSVYDTEKIVRTLWNNDSQTNGYKQQVNIFEATSKLPNSKELLGDYDEMTNSFVYYHGLGEIPIKIMLNKPFQRFFQSFGSNIYYQSPFTTTDNFQNTGYGYDSIKDTATCSGAIAGLQNIYTQENKLMIIDKPRVVVSGVNQTSQNELLQKKAEWLSWGSELIVNAGVGQGMKVDVMNPSNNIMLYQDLARSYWIDIFKASGLSYLTQSGSQKTAMESANTFQESIEEVNFMRSWLTEQWIEVIEKSFKIMGIDLGKREDWSFQVKKNIVTDEAAMSDRLIKEIQQGTRTPVQYIAIMEGVDEDYAEHIYKENEKWFKENDYPIVAKDGGAGVSGVKGASLPTSNEKGGRPTDKGKEGK